MVCTPGPHPISRICGLSDRAFTAAKALRVEAQSPGPARGRQQNSFLKYPMLTAPTPYHGEIIFRMRARRKHLQRSGNREPFSDRSLQFSFSCCERLHVFFDRWFQPTGISSRVNSFNSGRQTSESITSASRFSQPVKPWSAPLITVK